MNKLTRFLQAGTFAIIATTMLAGPGVMELQAKEGSDKPVLAGPKAEKEGDNKGKRFDGERKRDGDALHKLLSELNLTSEQKEKVKDIMVEARTARAEWYKTNGEKMKELQKEMQAAREAKDQEKGKAVGEQVKALRESMPKPQENMAKVREVLTPEQQTVFDAKIQEMKEQRMGAKAKGPNKEERKNAKGGKEGKSKKSEGKKSDTQDGELEL